MGEMHKSGPTLHPNSQPVRLVANSSQPQSDPQSRSDLTLTVKSTAGKEAEEDEDFGGFDVVLSAVGRKPVSVMH